MISDVRQQYNAHFTDQKYQQFLHYIAKQYNHNPPFRIAETPVFVSRELRDTLFDACERISDVICREDFDAMTSRAIESHYEVPNENPHTLFLQMDFAITLDADGNYLPQLIEVQGFPSLYFYQDLVADAYQKFFRIPDNFSHLFGISSAEYLALLRKVIVGDHDPKNVVLLEVEPHKQVTHIDFLGAAHHLGIKIACVTDLKKDGRTVYYVDENGARVKVERIFNRVIFDELVERTDLQRDFLFTEPCDVTWAGHPNWFFRISKYTLPFLKNRYVPDCTFLDELTAVPEELHNYVLKPLYSFSGSGVIYHLKKEDLENIKNPRRYILQRKIQYHPVVQSPDELVKTEIRMLMIWEDGQPRPRIVNNLARLSKGEMIGVKYNRNKTWVGGSVAFFEK